MPGVTIGEDSLVGANTLVSKDVKAETIVIGNPMKEIGDVRKIKSKVTEESVYPWKYTFDRGMPWEKIGFNTWKDNLKKELV